MFEPRLHRLETLIARASRPGGAYPPFALATRDVSAEGRAAMSELLDRSPLASAWRVWRNADRLPSDRAFALADLEPSMAHIHLLAADLSLRNDDAHAEPHPELRAALLVRHPGLWKAYASILVDLQRDFDNTSEMYALRRGFGHYADRARSIVMSGADLECFSRACCVWGQDTSFGRAVLPRGEVVESSLTHDASGAHGTLSPEDFAALECPELLTTLALGYAGVSHALRTLDRAPRLRALTIRTSELTGDADEGRALARLPLDTLKISVPSNSAVLVPRWVATLPSLRTLSLEYPKGSTDGGDVDLPASVCELGSLTSLSVSGVRSLPDSLDRLVNLRSLAVHGWHFIGLPPSLVALERLETLRVDPTLNLPGVPAGFEQLHALRSVRLGHLSSPEIPEALLRMPWLRRVELLSKRRWPATQEEALRRALPNAEVFVSFTGNAR